MINRRNFFAGAATTVGAVALGAAAAAPAAAKPEPGFAAPTGQYRVDLHAHFLPPEYRAALLSHGHFTIGGYPTPTWSPEADLAFQDYYGISARVLAVSDPGVSFLAGKEAIDLARYCNTYAADLIKKHPKRFGSFAVLPLPNLIASIAELAYALDVLHLDGVTLLSAYDGVYLGDPRYEPLMMELNRRSAYVFVHPAAIPDNAKPHLPLPDFLAEFTFDTTRAATMMMMTGVMERYPNIRFQLAHAGGTLPFLTHRIGVASQTVLGRLGLPKISLLDVKAQVAGMYYDTALSAAPTAMNSVLAATSRDHIVFGSDWPFSGLVLDQHGDRDPAPGLSETFTTEQRLEIERHNPLKQLPRLKAAIGR
ncbi:amidohydrolase family protein [Tsukamurella pseudospumae]|uniref:2-amino-3-carboxymuconate-6-semialdehyde decarboxylase n=1 Tax=Tsukamurella pseudospumae TaxID=239498 RepID=A0A137ZJH5_9ACTN|nr:amidohydrolase family protein [Tsukamurella pseudospumae]KXO98346.1 2-amino-3-carboxymuconate-6-semialdehyde decarboxylase [Tsukamurella pseudospumae]